MRPAQERMLMSFMTGVSVATRSLPTFTYCREWVQLLLLHRSSQSINFSGELNILLNMQLNNSLNLHILSSFTVFYFQAPTRAPAPHPRPSTLERPQQRSHTVLVGESTSTGVPQSTSGPSSSSSQAVLGRLAYPPNLMTRCWMPSGELSHQFLRIDTSLEPVLLLKASKHMSQFSSSKTLF